MVYTNAQKPGRGGDAVRPHSEYFERFAESLTPEERAAVQRWLDVAFDIIRSFQTDGSLPPESIMPGREVEALERNFSSALAKAVVCMETVFRGLSVTTR